MREKYIDESVGVWFVFGVHKNGNVDISDGSSDIFSNINPELAEKLCGAQSDFRDKLYSILKDE
jgi:hypothetical protein